MTEPGLLSLLNDTFISNMLRYIGEDHAFAAALTCRTFAQEARRNARNDARRRLELPFDAAEPAKLYRTPVRAVVNTVELCEWARDTGCWNSSVCAFAAWFGNFEVLQWARQNGCPWDWRTYEWARKGHVRQWADENGCPWSKHCPVLFSCFLAFYIRLFFFLLLRFLFFYSLLSFFRSSFIHSFFLVFLFLCPTSLFKNKTAPTTKN
jgi:hypothetical protein